MKNKIHKWKNIIGLFLVLIFLLINLYTLNDYGLTWDFSYHFQAGLWHLGKQTSSNFVMGPSAPLSDTFPVIFYQFVYEKLKLFPFDSAYNLYSTIIGSIGVGILFFFLKSFFNFPVAFFSSLSLMLLPRYFGHLHNNMKDVPQSVFFTLTLWMFWRLYQKPNIKNLFLSSLSFALAYNSKINAVFILLINFLFITILFFFSNFNKSKLWPKQNYSRNLILLFFLTAPLTAFCLWSLFWNNPLERLKEAIDTYTSSTTNMPILYFGKIIYSGQNIPWHYPWGILLVTTPLFIVFFFLLGLLSCPFLKKISFEAKIFLFLWFFIPLLRYFKPKIVIIDDIRHFLEIVFPLSAFSGIGIYLIYLFLNHILKNIFPRIIKLFIIFLFFFSLKIYLLWQIVAYHPFQTSYYSEIIGGIKGAQGRFDIEFWGSSYKKILPYLNQFAPQNAKITIPMAPDIAQYYLRDDLKNRLNQKNLAGADPKIYEESDYTVILNRESFFGWYGITPYVKTHTPIVSLRLYDVPLVSIYKNK